MAKKVILTIDDEEHILDLLEYNLGKNGYEVLRADTGEKGLTIMKTMQVDLVLLDYMLPGMDGIEVLKEMRADKNLSTMPVIMLTAKGEEIDKVLGLEMGADDYISKPFGIRELLARVKALLRRSSLEKIEAEPEDKITAGDLLINNIIPGSLYGWKARIPFPEGVRASLSSGQPPEPGIHPGAAAGADLGI